MVIANAGPAVGPRKLIGDFDPVFQSVGEADHFHLRNGASDESSPAWPTMVGGRVLGERGNRGLRFDSPEARHARPRLVAVAASQLFNSPRLLSASALPIERPQARGGLVTVQGAPKMRSKQNSLHRRSNRKTPAKNSRFRGPSPAVPELTFSLSLSLLLAVAVVGIRGRCRGDC